MRVGALDGFSGFTCCISNQPLKNFQDKCLRNSKFPTVNDIIGFLSDKSNALGYWRRFGNHFEGCGPETILLTILIFAQIARPSLCQNIREAVILQKKKLKTLHS